MKAKFLTGILILCFFNNLCALPVHTKDTIQQTKEQSTYSDNIKILLGLATKVYTTTPEKSLQYAQTALGLARSKKDKISEAKILATIGDIYYKLDYDKLALPYYMESWSIAKSLNIKLQLADYSMHIGDTYYKLHAIDSATRYYQQSMILYRKLNHDKGIADIYLRFGNTNWFTATYDKALDYYLKSLVIYNKINYNPGMARIYNNIGSLYTILDDNKNAMINFQKALHYFKDYDDSRSLSELYFRLGAAYERNKQYDSAFYYFDWAKTMFDSLHLENKIAVINQSIGSIYFAQGRYNDALTMAKKTLDTYIKYDNKWGITEVSNNLAIYYIKVEDYSKALNFLQQSLQLSKEINSVELLKITYLNYSKYYKEKEQYKNALHYYTLYQEMNDSVLTKEKTKRIAELQAQYEAENQLRELQKKDEELTRNNELIRRQRRNLYIFGTGIILILFMSFGLYRQYRLLEHKKQKIQLINEELDQRVKDKTTALRLTQFSIDQAADPIFWIEAGGQFIYVNNAACKYLEFSKNELLSKNITSLIPRFTTPDWNDIWDIIKSEGLLVIESEFNKKDKTKLPVEINFNYIFHEEKEYAFAFIHNIADRKLKEENLRKAKEKAEEADKLKSAFLANMSHEIRTPMNAIIGFSDLLLQDETSREEKKEFGDIIKNSGDTLLKLIDDIIDISLIEAGQLKMNVKLFNLNILLKEILRFYQEEKVRLEKQHIDIRLNEANFNNQIYIHADKIRFRQIITNLVGNALKFTEKGSVEIGYSQNTHGMLQLYVKDTGIGIAGEKLAVIFERFIKVSDEKKLYSGTGLGLAISKKLAEQMGGNLNATSELGKGSAFLLTIPFETQTFPIEKEEIIVEHNRKYNWVDKSVLIVEDVESNYQLLETFLKKTGIKIHWAKDGKEALHFCKKHCPDAVLMDIQLPTIDGYEVTREILSRYPAVPIIAQTAFAIVGEKEKILEAGCVDYITKPIDSAILYETMYKYLG
jgi:PAS domain S-box-containing protein